jgi:hypothetical protein
MDAPPLLAGAVNGIDTVELLVTVTVPIVGADGTEASVVAKTALLVDHALVPYIFTALIQ